MICAYTSICEKCSCCCSYFSAYLAFLLEIVQLLNLVFLVIFIVLTSDNLHNGGELQSAAIMTICAIILNAIHNVVTVLIAGFRGNSETDVMNLKSLLCCYICCPNCGSCWDMIMGVFGCTCIVDLIDGCFDTYERLMILVIIQIVTGILTFSLGFKASSIVDDKNSFSKAVLLMSVAFFVFAAFNILLNLICLIHYYATNCSCKKKPVYPSVDDSANENQSPDQGNNNTQNNQPNPYNNDQNIQQNMDNNGQIFQPNQNQDPYAPPVATLQNNDNPPNQMDLFDPENPNSFNQQKLTDPQNVQNP